MLLKGSYKIEKVDSNVYYTNLLDPERKLCSKVETKHYCKSLERKTIFSKKTWIVVKSPNGYSSVESALIDMKKYILENEDSLTYVDVYRRFEETKHLLQW